MSCTRVHEQNPVCVESAGLGAIDWTVCHGKETAGGRGTTTASFYCTHSITAAVAAAAVSLPSCQLARPAFCCWQVLQLLLTHGSRACRVGVLVKAAT